MSKLRGIERQQKTRKDVMYPCLCSQLRAVFSSIAPVHARPRTANISCPSHKSSWYNTSLDDLEISLTTTSPKDGQGEVSGPHRNVVPGNPSVVTHGTPSETIDKSSGHLGCRILVVELFRWEDISCFTDPRPRTRRGRDMKKKKKKNKT